MDNTNYPIIPLPKSQWEGTIILMGYKTEEYYDIRIEKMHSEAHSLKKAQDGYRIHMPLCRFDSPVTHTPEEYDFPDRLYQPHWEKASAWGIVEKEGEKDTLLACIETCPEEWSNRLMVTELWVHEKLRRQGIAHRLMSLAKEQAILENRRAIILETQSCNVGAIRFYLSEGFEPIGFDSCCYSNRDLERREVRINMGYFPKTPGKENT